MSSPMPWFVQNREHSSQKIPAKNIPRKEIIAVVYSGSNTKSLMHTSLKFVFMFNFYVFFRSVTHTPDRVS